jgi:uncharacterized protein YacL
VTDERPPINAAEQDERSRTVLLRIVRLAFVVTFFTVTLLNILSIDQKNPDPGQAARAQAWPLVLAVTFAIAAVVIAIDVFTPRKKVSTLFSIFLGLLGAMIASLALGAVIDLVVQSYQITDSGLVALVKVLIGIGLAYLVIVTVLQTQDDFRLVVPYVEFVKQIRGPRPMLLDSSVLIDGRIYDLVQTGIISQPVVVPRFIVNELQTLADSSDRSKRAKGRRGLSMIEKLQASAAIDLRIEDPILPGMAADQMLIELARTMPAMIVTTDTGLAKVADIQKVAVLRLNDVAAALRSPALPGETIQILLQRPGEQPGQAVGFLDEGTMVVVDHAADRIGADVRATVTSSIPTGSGRIVFARLADRPPPPPPPPSPRPAQHGAVSLADQGTPPAEASSSQAAQGAASAGGESADRPPDETPVEPPPSGKAPGAPTAPQGPFPAHPPKSLRTGSPRNPRR